MSTIAHARSTFDRVAAYPSITLSPLDGARWTSARFGLGPFPARLLLDPEADAVKAQVALRGFPGLEVEEAMQAVSYPSPMVIIPLTPNAVPVLEYQMPVDSASEEQALGLLGACALYTVALLESIWPDVDQAWREWYVGTGFTPSRGFGSDARHLLSLPPVPYPDWDTLRGA